MKSDMQLLLSGEVARMDHEGTDQSWFWALRGQNEPFANISLSNFLFYSLHAGPFRVAWETHLSLLNTALIYPGTCCPEMAT